MKQLKPSNDLLATDTEGTSGGTAALKRAWSSRRGGRPLAIAAAAALAISAVLALSFALTKRSGSASSPATDVAVLSVTVEPASVKPVHQRVTVTGSIWAWDPLAIGAELGGLRIDQVLVEEGDLVKQGQVLATLNSSVLRSELEREQAQLASALAALDKAVQPNRREEILALSAAVAQAEAAVAQEQARLTQAQANLVNARQNAERYADLLRQGAISAQETETRETQAKVAQAEVSNAHERVSAAQFALKQAKEKLSMAESGGRREDVRIAQAEVARIRADIRRLKALLEQTVIRAPSDGLITKRLAHIGDTSAVGEDLFQMVRDNRLELRAQVPERDLPLLKPGQEVTITCAATGKAAIEGRLREVSPQVDPDTRLGMIRVDVPSQAGLKPGMFVEGNVELEDYPALTVPSQAVVTRDDRSILFVLNGDRALARFVELGARSGDRTEVKSGLKAGDPVITSGAGFLKDGDIVTVVAQ